MRHRRIGRYRKRRGRKFLIFTILLVVLIVFLDSQLRPLIRNMAATQARAIFNNSVNEAVLDQLSVSGANYSDLVNIEKDSSGKVLAISSNVVRMNELKAAVSLKVQERLTESQENGYHIPIGTLLGSELLHGRGPGIPMKISLAGSIVTDFESNFTEAGVNQTRHQIYMKVTATVFVMIPGYDTSTQVETSVPVAETVIVGDVPNVYAGLNNSATAADIAGLANLAKLQE